jgi:hypothetical protein
MQATETITDKHSTRTRLHSYSYNIKERTTGDLTYNLHNLCILRVNTSHTSTMESSQNTLRSYALALLTLMGNQPGADGKEAPFGIAMCMITKKTVYNQTAHRVLEALIEYSPSPESVAQQFLTELGRCENSDVEDLGA